jgi:hypothetical protein
MTTALLDRLTLPAKSRMEAASPNSAALASFDSIVMRASCTRTVHQRLKCNAAGEATFKATKLHKKQKKFVADARAATDKVTHCQDVFVS